MMFHRIRFAGPNPGPHLLITGGVHGDELEPPAAIRQLIGLLTPRLLRGSVTLVPVVNEPAFRRAQRTAEDGLDLARTCPGSATGSVTQQIAAVLSDLIRTADFYIDLHTGGTRLRLVPLCGYMLHRDPSVLASQRRMARTFGLPLIWGTDPTLDGRSLSVARDAGIPAIYAEYLGGCGSNPAAVTAYVSGCLGVLAELGLIEVQPTRNPPPPLVIEDPRPDSGFLQRQHPAPCDGYFVPQAALGQRVQTGETLGTISTILGDTLCQVFAAHAGIVIGLRDLPWIAAGECVAVVLETESTLTLTWRQ